MPGYAGTTTNFHLLQSSHHKKYLPNFPAQKIPQSKISNPKNPSIIPVTWNLKWSAAQSQREREKIKREEREREKKGGFLLFSPPPPGPPHCCFFCSVLFAPSPLSERLEQAICYGTLFSLLENVTINYYQYVLGLERNIPKKCSKNLSGNSQFFSLKIPPKISKYSKNFLKIPKHPKNFLKNPEYPKIF